jgi:molybdopterin converting factor small subunit
MPVTVEFFGLPRQRAGRAELTTAARTVRDALEAVRRACPNLAGVLTPDGRVNAQYLVSLNGERFVTDLREPLPPGARLLLLGADAGG